MRQARVLFLCGLFGFFPEADPGGYRDDCQSNGHVLIERLIVKAIEKYRS